MERKREKIIASLPEVGDLRDSVPSFFTPECVNDGEEATGKYKGRFLCKECLQKAMQDDGLI